MDLLGKQSEMEAGRVLWVVLASREEQVREFTPEPPREQVMANWTQQSANLPHECMKAGYALAAGPYPGGHGSKGEYRGPADMTMTPAFGGMLRGLTSQRGGGEQEQHGRSSTELSALRKRTPLASAIAPWPKDFPGALAGAPGPWNKPAPARVRSNQAAARGPRLHPNALLLTSPIGLPSDFSVLGKLFLVSDNS